MICPICGNSTLRRYRPFCSGKCADRDLVRWLKGAYALSVSDAGESESEWKQASSPRPNSVVVT